MRSFAALSWLILAGACASPRTYPRTLLIDQLPAHSRRMDVWHTLRAGGWCPMPGTPGRERFRKCDGSAPMLLRLTFYEDKLVHAVFVSFFRSPPRWDAPSPIPAARASQGPEDARSPDKRARIRDGVAPTLVQDGLLISPAARHLESRMFGALAAELVRRYGPAETRTRQAHSGTSWQIGVWRPSSLAAVELVVTSGMIIETWAFAPWELHRVPTPRELRVARGEPEPPPAPSPAADPSSSPACDAPAVTHESPLSRANDEPSPAEAIPAGRVVPKGLDAPAKEVPRRMRKPRRAAKPCRPEGRCPTGWFCVKSERRHVCLPGDDRETTSDPNPLSPFESPPPLEP